MVRLTGIVWLLVVCVLAASGQNMHKMEKKAQKAFYQEDFEQAIKEYNEILAVNSRHKLAKYRLVKCSLLVYPRTTPINTILIYKKTQGRKDKFFYYWLGRIYFLQSNFKKAIQSWVRFLESDKYKSTEIKEETQEYIKWAEMANEQYNNPKNYEIEHLSDVINSPYTEYSPVYFKESDELLFLSSKNSLLNEFEIFHSFREVGKWSEPTRLKEFGKYSQSNANIEVTNEGGHLYMYREIGHHKGDLFYSEKDADGAWQPAVKADPGLSASKLESHFFINAEGTRVLFAHRKMHKPFDLDIYESKKDPRNGKWSKPDLFSSSINSEFDEDYPFLSEDGNTIYFSSKRHGTIGGYDIFKSEYDATLNYWGDPESLSYPTNSTYDDIQFKIDEQTNSGYFVSDRVGSYGSFDIFFFHESAKILLAGKVLEGKGRPADHAQIHFTPARKTNLPVKAMTDSVGDFQVRLGNDDQVKVEIYFHDDLVYEAEIETPHSSGEEVKMRLDFMLEEEKLEEEPIIDEHVDPQFADVDELGSKFRETNRARLNNLYFDPGSYHLKRENHERISDLLDAMLEYPNLQIEIAGHTDNIGDPDENHTLSFHRADAVLRYLMFHGVEGDRMLAKGYGATRPLASNDDEKEGRELNRRIEVVVIE